MYLVLGENLVEIVCFPMKAFTVFVVLLASAAVDGVIFYEKRVWYVFFHGTSMEACFMRFVRF